MFNFFLPIFAEKSEPDGGDIRVLETRYDFDAKSRLASAKFDYQYTLPSTQLSWTGTFKVEFEQGLLKNLKVYFALPSMPCHLRPGGEAQAVAGRQRLQPYQGSLSSTSRPAAIFNEWSGHLAETWPADRPPTHSWPNQARRVAGGEVECPVGG